MLAARIRCHAAILLAAAWLVGSALAAVDTCLAVEWDQRTAPLHLPPVPPDHAAPLQVAYHRTAAQPPAAPGNQAAPRSSPAAQQQAASRANQPSTSSDARRSQGAARAPQSRAPYMIGDFFGGASLHLIYSPPAQTINTNFQGFGTPSDPFDIFNSPIEFSLNAGGPVLLVSLAPGSDVSGDMLPDTYGVPPPPPQLTPIPPGPGQLTFSNGVLTYTQGTGAAVDGYPFLVSGPPSADYELALEHTFQPEQIVVSVPNPGSGGGVGRVKISENASPLPRDRVFHNFSYFHGVPLTTNGVSVSRFVPGFEKTLFDGMASVEMRFPLAATLDNDILVGGPTSTQDVNFGNISIPLKVLLYDNPSWALAAGVQFTVPTASDSRVLLDDGSELIHIDNRSVHVMPYLGALYTPNERLFAQGFFQIDIDSNGNPVSVANGYGSMDPIGRLDDQTLMYIDVGVGYWLYQNEFSRGLTGLAPTVELHVNQSLDNADVLNAGSFQVGSLRNNITSTNLVVGSNLQFGSNTSATLGYAVPLSNNAIDLDGELRVLVNHRFGPSSRASRAQF